LGYHWGVIWNTTFYNWYTRANDSKRLKDQQDTVDVCNNYFSSVIDKISKNNVDNLINDDIFSTFHYYLEQN